MNRIYSKELLNKPTGLNPLATEAIKENILINCDKPSEDGCNKSHYP
jgi:hypothetical protein